MSRIVPLGFGTVVLVAMLVLHGYLWWRLVRGTTGPGPVRRALTTLTAVLVVLPALAIGLRGTLPLEHAAPLDWVAYSWLGIAFYLFLARGLAVTAGAVALGTAGTGAVIANSPPVVRRVPITLPRLDPTLDGLRIVTFSDAHLSATYTDGGSSAWSRSSTGSARTSSRSSATWSTAAWPSCAGTWPR